VTDPQSNYLSFLVRLWREKNTDKAMWRIALVNLQTDERRGFADFERLVDYLKEELRGGADITTIDVDEPQK
jgi:hypothetical protein